MTPAINAAFASMSLIAGLLLCPRRWHCGARGAGARDQVRGTFGRKAAMPAW